MPNGRFEWTPHAVARLKQLWASDKATGRIGQELGCGKNAAIGKAHPPAHDRLS